MWWYRRSSSTGATLAQVMERAGVKPTDALLASRSCRRCWTRWCAVGARGENQFPAPRPALIVTAMTRAKVLVTGSAGHLGEALARVLCGHDYEVTGLDLLASPGTDAVGSVTERARVRDCLAGVSVLRTARFFPEPDEGWRDVPRINRVLLDILPTDKSGGFHETA